MAENVVIKIDVRADTATIERLRAQLRSLCREADDCNDVFERQSNTLRDLSGEHRRTARESDGLTKSMRGSNKESRNNRKSFADLRRELFNVGGATKSLLGMVTGLIKFGFKYLAIEAAAAAVTLAGATLLFKTGAFFAKTYQATLSAVAYGFAAAAAAASTFIAAQRQFQSVQLGPMYAGGSVNTTDQYAAASGAMKMFVDDAKLAVLGSQALTGAFTTLSKQAPVTGQTVAVFRQLSNVTTGIGGDIAKNTQGLADFLAAMQKGGLGGADTQAAIKTLGPEFKKITDEANKLGLTTYEKFAEAAMAGQLGETFGKYAGQLNALNSTLVGQFKTAFTNIKGILNDIGEPLLEPVTIALRRVTRAIEVMFLQTRANIESFGATDLLDHLVSGFEKITGFITKILTHNLMGAGDIFNGIANGFRAIGDFFEKLQDFFRPLQDAGQVILDIMSVIGGAIFGNFKNTLQEFGVTLVVNRDSIMEFAESIGNFIKSFGEFGSQLRKAFIQALPVFTSVANALTRVVDALTSIFKIFNAGGTMGSILGFASLFLGFRAAKIGGGMMNKNINNRIKGGISGSGGAAGALGGGMSSTQVMNVNATAVYLNGPVVSGTPPATPVGGQPTPPGGGRGGRFGRMFGNASFLAPLAMMLGGQAIGSMTSGRSAGVEVGGATLSNALQAAAIAKFLGVGASGATGVGLGIGAFTLGKGIASNVFGANTTASRVGGAATGIASGAAAGALTGTALTAWLGPGAAFGAVGGAIIGGIAGGIGGYFGAGKKQRDTDKAAKKLVEGYGDAVTNAIAAGDLDALMEAQTAASTELQKLQKSNEFGAGAVEKQRKEIEKYDRQIANYTSNAERFASLYGVGTDEMNAILQNLGIDGTKSIKSVYDVLKQAGYDTAEAIRTRFVSLQGEIISGVLGVFDTGLEQLQSQKRVNALQSAIAGGATDKETILQYLDEQYKYALSKAGGDPILGMLAMSKTLETGAAQGLYGKGGDTVLKTAAEFGFMGGGKVSQEMLKLLDPVMAEIGTKAADMLGMKPGALTDILKRQVQDGNLPRAAQINEAYQKLISGEITSGQFARLVSDPTAGRAMFDMSQLPPGISRTAFGEGETRGRLVDPSAAGTSRTVNVGGIKIEVSGFISDPATAKIIAEKVAEQIRREVETSGATGRSGTMIIR